MTTVLLPCPARPLSLALRLLALLVFWSGLPVPARANLPGGGTNGPNVGLVDNGSSVTLTNGIVSLLCQKSGGNITAINYTYNNNGTVKTQNLLGGGYNGGQLYWENSSSQGLTFSYSLVVNPATNGGNYAEISLLTTSVVGDQLEVHYSLLRGNSGFYTTAIYRHSSTDGAFGMGECRDNIYAGALFNWMCVDNTRNKLMEVSGGSAIAVQGAPKEVSLWTNGLYQGRYEDKYKYCANLGEQHVWGWGSVGSGGANVGLWNVSASAEYYNGGPLKRELIEHIGTTILNVLNGGHYGMGSDGAFTNGEVWAKVCGPYFIYCNNVTNTLTAAPAASQALFADALAQGAAEASAWPYSWFNQPDYAPASARGSVSGKIVINDRGNPNASAGNLWVGLIQQPATSSGTYDFQEWMKPYQFWTHTDANGNFTLDHVIAGTNYTLYAFGPGAADTFLSQPQTGGNPPLILDFPTNLFAVTVTGGGSNNLGNVYWVPTRTGATVFEIGAPNRKGDKFKHGDDFWVGDIGPSPTVPSPIWSKWLEYPLEFPTGPNYVVGQSRWSTDWNFIQPVQTDSQGNYNNSSSTITFTLATAPTNGATAAIYLGLASDYYSAIIISVNGNNLASVGGVTATPNAESVTGYYTGYNDSDSNIREGINAAFSDERITFPASLLNTGTNTLTIGIRQEGSSYFANHAMYDYVRLELTGYVPPAPSVVTAFPGNAANLVTWPVTPGATSYNLLRSSTNTGGFTTLTNGVLGPVCGSGTNNATFLDLTVTNGGSYYYQVKAVNPTGASAPSPASNVAVPAASYASTAPASPIGLTVTAATHQSVTLTWSPVAGANLYSLYRSTLVDTGGGSSNVLSTILLNNALTNTTFTDTTPTDGSIYQYSVAATSAGGTSSNTPGVVTVPLPTAPASVPPSLFASFSTPTNIVLTWSAVPGAVGYVISRATSPAGPYTYLQTITETVYYDSVASGTLYYYRVSAMNAAANTAAEQDAVNYNQPAPASLTALGTNTAVVLTWSAPANATSYTVKRGLSLGNETTLVVSGYSGTAYTNSGLVNGTTYYYVVTASGTKGSSGNSPEVNATPLLTGSGLWINPYGGLWGTATNWNSAAIASGNGTTADFSSLPLPANLNVTLDSPRTLSGLIFGDVSNTFSTSVTGTNPLTLGTAATVTVQNQTATLAVPLAGTNLLTKTGPGTLVLTASNTLTGGLALNQGTLTLDFSSGNPPGNLVPAANSLTLGGGTLLVRGNSTNSASQSFATTSLNPGLSLLAATNNATNNATVNLGPISANPNAGALIEFFGPGAHTTLTTTLSGNAAFVFGGCLYATVGLTDYAVTTNSSAPYSIVGGSQVPGFYTTVSGSAPSAAYEDVTGSITGWSSQPYLTALRFNTPSSGGVTVNCTGLGGTLTDGTLLLTPNLGTNNVTVTGGTIRPGTAAYTASPFIVWQNNPSAELLLNSSISNGKYQPAAYVQAGPGTVLLANSGNSYTTGTDLNGGVTLVPANGALGAPATGASVNLNGGTLLATTSFTLDNNGANARPVNLGSNGGGLAAASNMVLTVDGLVGSGSGAGPLVIGLAPSAANNYLNGLVPGTGPGSANSTPLYASGTVLLTAPNYHSGGTVLQSGTLNFNGLYALGGANYSGLTFNGGTLQYAANFPGTNGSADVTLGPVSLTAPATIDFNGNAVTYANGFSGGLASLSLRSSLPGARLTWLGNSSYSGATTVSNLFLALNNPAGSPTGPGPVTLQNGATLSGSGSVAGSVNVQSGGTLAVFQLSDSLDIGGQLTLTPGSTNLFQIQAYPPTNATINVTGTATLGGTLVISNLGGTFLLGATFPLISAGTFIGQFSALSLPALNPGLYWNTNALASNGILSVATTNVPSLTGFTNLPGQFQLSGIGGLPSASCYLLTSTNLTAPFAAWTIIATNTCQTNGAFTLTTTPPAPNTPARFYAVEIQ